MNTISHRLTTVIFMSLLSMVSLAYSSVVDSKTVVLTDVHGDYETLTKLLQTTQVIDSDLKWTGKAETLISLGDNLDRGPDSRKVIDLFMRLEQEAKQSGDQVIVLLGNHEIMNIIADLRYVSDEEFLAFAEDESTRYRQSVYKDFLHYMGYEDNRESQQEFLKLYPPGYFGLVEAYSPQGKYGQWLLSKDTVKTHQNRLYLHAGISDELLDQGLSEHQINTAIRETVRNYADLYHEFIKVGLFKHYFNKRQRLEVLDALLSGQIKSDRLTKKSILKKAETFIKLSNSLLITTEGPVWYRGNIYCHEYMEQETIEKALRHFNVKQILVGHTPDSSRVARSRFDGKVILLDTGMLQTHYKGHPTAAIIENDQLSLVNLDDPTNTQPLPDPVRKPLFPNQLSDDYLSDYFSNAAVIAEQSLGDFFSKPLKLTFNHNGQQHSAIFKYLDSDPDLENKRKYSRLDNFSDRFLYDLAAYKLDRILGLYMVPYTAVYRYKDKTGIIQYWIEDSVSKTELIEGQYSIEGYCSVQDEEALMHYFDLLIHNDDRNTGNKLYSNETGFLWLIDHTRSFRTTASLPDYELPFPTYLSPEFKQKLSSLTQSNLETSLGDYLNSKQIKALLKRRDEILERLSQ